MSSRDTLPDSEPPVETRLNLETALIPWRELQRFFAAGCAVAVAPELDLVSVGAELARDNIDAFRPWMEQGQVGAVSDDQAQAWLAADVDVWALVVKPYVLVQHRAQ